MTSKISNKQVAISTKHESATTVVHFCSVQLVKICSTGAVIGIDVLHGQMKNLA